MVYEKNYLKLPQGVTLNTIFGNFFYTSKPIEFKRNLRLR